MPVRVSELCDELTRTGNLFILLSTDQAGMSYVRVLPASEIEEILSKPNDIEQPVSFKLKASLEEVNPQPIPAYDPLTDEGTDSGHPALFDQPPCRGAVGRARSGPFAQVVVPLFLMA